MILWAIEDGADIMEMLALSFGHNMHHAHPRLLLLPAPSFLSGAFMLTCDTPQHGGISVLLSLN